MDNIKRPALHMPPILKGATFLGIETHDDGSQSLVFERATGDPVYVLVHTQDEYPFIFTYKVWASVEGTGLRGSTTYEGPHGDPSLDEGGEVVWET